MYVDRIRFEAKTDTRTSSTQHSVCAVKGPQQLTLNTSCCCSCPAEEAARSWRSFIRWLRALSVRVMASDGAVAGSADAAAAAGTVQGRDNDTAE